MILAMVLGCVMSVMAQSATINNIWVDHDVYDNGVKGMRIHIKFGVQGLKNESGYIGAYFYDRNKNEAKNFHCDSKYRTSDGLISIGKTINPRYENSTYEDLKLFMPYHIFNNLKSGKYYFVVCVFSHISDTFKQLTCSDWRGFTYTSGNNNVASNNSSNNNHSNRSNNRSNRFANGRTVGEQWRETHNNNVFIMIQNSDGSVKAGIEQCFACTGNGICKVCNGTGAYALVQCVWCKGTGRCFNCNGTGKKVTIWMTVWPKVSFPQLAGNPGCYTWHDDYYAGTPTNNNTNWSNGYNTSPSSNSSSSTNSNSPSKTQCTCCGGSGKNNGGKGNINYSTNYTGNDNTEYCDICKSYGPRHYHTQTTCPCCHGTGFIKL